MEEASIFYHKCIIGITEREGGIVGSINLYKIDVDKKKQCLRDLESRMDSQGKKVSDNYTFEFFLDSSCENRQVAWNWVFNEFEIPEAVTMVSPRAVILISNSSFDSTYIATFGHSYFLIDKYCEKDFGIKFARKIEFEDIKTTTLSSANTLLSKTVKAYIHYSNLEFDSGESFAKIKAKMKQPDGFKLFKPMLEMGSSIKLSTQEDSLELLLKIVDYVEDIVCNSPDINRIPIFSKVKDKDLVDELNQKLIKSISDGNTQLAISELEIVGTNEIFNHNDNEYSLRYGSDEKIVSSSLSIEEVKAFCDEFDVDYSSTVLDISVIVRKDGKSVVTKKIKDYVEYTEDSRKCILSKGEWYKFNDDYLQYLHDSIEEIPTVYNSDFDFTASIHDEFVENQYTIEKNAPKYKNLKKDEAIIALKKDYYAERVFNTLRISGGFDNHDRECSTIDGNSFEAMDLYKEGAMYAVKLGNSSSKLCYAIDQSLSALKLLKDNRIREDLPEIDTVVIWLVLDRKTHIEDDNGVPDLNKLNMLMLKNRLCQWKKEVRLKGLKPKVFINYRSK